MRRGAGRRRSGAKTGATASGAAASEASLDSGFVFTTAVGSPIDPRNPNRHWYAVRKRTGLDGYRFHDLRHSFVSLLLDLGVPPHTVREVAGHSDLQVTLGVYAHASVDEKRSALARLSELLR
ncbi:tyrosine-type recombinase/integrase [Streptacidiphilus sp. ASG 303]|uniref:tyrosine-type recombinase/integrase n=1 Tax=Streptacidiphilus sp. ASG 303 TaxID=2896847 RepID=UPI001E3334F2|nr:tyrosine-type recombinase/integrase [Streptacidiphilus sp. ASG 303]MCD0485410.1 tyrosine-type recombinase/integrase [Streptacidiphilus sp. ASG 303]